GRFGSSGRFGSGGRGRRLYAELVARRGIRDAIDVEAVLLLELGDRGGGGAVIGAGLRRGDLRRGEGALHRAHILTLQRRLGRVQVARLTGRRLAIGQPP